jgi:hypothetical protein
LFETFYCKQETFLIASELIFDLFKGIGIGIAFFGVSYFIEKSKEDYVKENEVLHSIIHSDRSMQELYSNYLPKDCHYDQEVYKNFLNYMEEHNPMFVNGLHDTARVIGKNGNDGGISYPHKPQGIDIHSLFFLHIKDIKFIVFKGKKKQYQCLSDSDVSRVKDAGIFKIELFSGGKYIYCPKLDKTKGYNTEEEFNKYYAVFEKNDKNTVHTVDVANIAPVLKS